MIIYTLQVKSKQFICFEASDGGTNNQWLKSVPIYSIHQEESCVDMWHDLGHLNFDEVDQMANNDLSSLSLSLSLFISMNHTSTCNGISGASNLDQGKLDDK